MLPKLHPAIIQSLRRIRPAPLQVFITTILRVSRRREISFGDYTFHCDPVSDLGSRLLRGTYEDDMTQVLNKYLRPGGVFLDLGANEGFFTVLGSRLVGPA